MTLDATLNHSRPENAAAADQLDIRATAFQRTRHRRRFRYRSVWISDFHLGTRGCRAHRLIDFLDQIACDSLYLVGDIVDAWALKKAWCWPGNHDELLRDYLPLDLAGIDVCDEAVHATADGRRFLVVHGDAFDAVCTEARWLAVLGDHAYRAVIVGNSWFNTARRRLGYPYWSLSAFLKHQVKNAVSYISKFEHALADEARRRGFAGIICGHIHCAQQTWIGDIEYCNDGDWIESCSALVEDAAGRLSVVYWGREDTADTQAESKRAVSA